MTAITVIIPVYNGATYIQDAIDSVIAQTHSDWELVVINDGSTDETGAIIAAVADPRIHYVYQPNQGQAAALNHGLALATGDYVTTLDADDWLTQDSLEQRATYLDQHPEHGAVYGDGFYCTAAGEPLLRFSEYRPGNPTGDVYDQLIVSCFFGTGAPVMIRRALLAQHQLRYDESIVWCQDWDFYLRLAEFTTFGYQPCLTVWYRLHNTNMTMTMPKGRQLDSLIRTKFKVLASTRFSRVDLAQKHRFFYGLLVNDLQGQPEAQQAVVQASQFTALPHGERSRLLRLLAAAYLLSDHQRPLAQMWSVAAWQLAPLDIKAIVVAVLASFAPPLSRPLLRAWRCRNPQTALKSLLDLSPRPGTPTS